MNINNFNLYKMNNINFSKLASLIETKKQSSSNNDQNNKSNLNKSRTSINVGNTSMNAPSAQTSQAIFKVSSLPNERVGLFEKKDFYHYERRFHNDLPRVTIPPLSFHYSSSIENLASYDSQTMMLGLKSHHEIMTDTKLNTKINLDFMENSICLLLPEKEKSFILEKSALKILKEDILTIIESEVATEAKTKLEDKLSPSPFYLRRSTIMGAAMNQKKQDKSRILVPNSNSNALSQTNLKHAIENSFDKIQEVQEGFEHPYKKGVVAKHVYEVTPFTELSDIAFAHLIFPDDPLKEINLKDKFKPERFLLKRNKNEETNDSHSKLHSFYKNEKSRDESDVDNTFDTNQAKYFTYERDFLVGSSTSENELFNRYFIFMNKQTSTAKITPIDNRFLLKKYKKIINVYNDPDENDNFNVNLNRKRERDVVLVPRSLTKDEIENKNRKLKEASANKLIKAERIEEINWDEVNEVREKLLKLESRGNPNVKEEICEEERDLFDMSGSDEEMSISNHTERADEELEY